MRSDKALKRGVVLKLHQAITNVTHYLSIVPMNSHVKLPRTFVACSNPAVSKEFVNWVRCISNNMTTLTKPIGLTVDESNWNLIV